MNSVNQVLLVIINIYIQSIAEIKVVYVFVFVRYLFKFLIVCGSVFGGNFIIVSVALAKIYQCRICNFGKDNL